MSLTTITLLVLALYVLQLFLQETSRYRFDLKAIMGNRDDPPAPSRLAARLDRAQENMREALSLYLGLALLAFTAAPDPQAAQPGALLFLVARVAYVPAYASGIPVLRSALWLGGMAGLLLMALSLF